MAWLILVFILMAGSLKVLRPKDRRAFHVTLILLGFVLIVEYQACSENKSGGYRDSSDSMQVADTECLDEEDENCIGIPEQCQTDPDLPECQRQLLTMKCLPSDIPLSEDLVNSGRPRCDMDAKFCESEMKFSLHTLCRD